MRLSYTQSKLITRIPNIEQNQCFSMEWWNTWIFFPKSLKTRRKTKGKGKGGKRVLCGGSTGESFLPVSLSLCLSLSPPPDSRENQIISYFKWILTSYRNIQFQSERLLNRVIRWYFIVPQWFNNQFWKKTIPPLVLIRVPKKHCSPFCADQGSKQNIVPLAVVISSKKASFLLVSTIVPKTHRSSSYADQGFKTPDVQMPHFSLHWII